MKTNQKSKDNKKTLKAVIVLIVLFILGGAFGWFMGYMSTEAESFDLTAIKEVIKNILIYATPVALLAVFVFVTVFSLIGYFKARKATANWDGENEAYIEKVETKLGIIISMLTIGLVLVYSLFGINAYAQFFLASGEIFMSMLPLSIAALFAMIATMVYNTIVQRACVQLIKKINPEKKGEALAVNFQKEWEQSMDEAQKLMLFETGFRTYKVMSHVIIFVWMVSVLGMMFGMGLMPMLIVSALWLTMTITYMVYGYKIEHKNKKR